MSGEEHDDGGGVFDKVEKREGVGPTSNTFG